MHKRAMAALAFLVSPPMMSLAQDCKSPAANGVPWEHRGAVLFKNKALNVDADGAPNSYRVDGKGLSYTCDGVVALENGQRVTPKTHPKDWQQKCNAAWANAQKTKDYSKVAIFGFETAGKNVPKVQQAGDPLPGTAYISATSVVIPGAPDGTQRRYVDATKIPYVVLPSGFVKQYKIKPGTLAVVYRKKTGKHAFAVFADSGDLGEASVKLHQDLGSDPLTKDASGIARAKARIEDPTLVAVFPQQVAAPRADAVAWNASIAQQGDAALKTLGGIAVLKSCAE